MHYELELREWVYKLIKTSYDVAKFYIERGVKCILMLLLPFT